MLHAPVTIQEPLVDTTLPNGVRVLVEPMPWLPTLSLTLQLPVGSVNDPEGGVGCAALLTEWLQRGAGDLDARAYASVLDDLGVRRGGGVGRETMSLSAAFLERDAADVFGYLADQVRRPRLGDEEFAGVRQLALHDLAAIDDSPPQRLGEALVDAYFASAHARSAYGERADLERATPEGVRAELARRVGPEGAVLVVAGGGDAARTLELAEASFGGWRGGTATTPPPEVRPPHRRHVHAEGAQVQIGLCDGAVGPTDHGWYEQQIAMGVLDGNMGARLFTEVREKRGLAYSVGASTRLVRGHAYTVVRAGTTPERAGETLDVLIEQMRHLGAGVTLEEHARAVRQLRSNMVMQNEASGARAGRLAADVLHVGRPRPLAEIMDALEGVGLDRVNEWLAARPEPHPTVVTLGPRELVASDRAA
ncbi:pitrilysin family protein [soil metagenome]